MADSSSDDDMLRLLQIQTIAVANEKEEEESTKTLLHVVDNRAAMRTRRLPRVGERIGTWGLPDISA